MQIYQKTNCSINALTSYMLVIILPLCLPVLDHRRNFSANTPSLLPSASPHAYNSGGSQKQNVATAWQQHQEAGTTTTTISDSSSSFTQGRQQQQQTERVGRWERGPEHCRKQAAGSDEAESSDYGGSEDSDDCSAQEAAAAATAAAEAAKEAAAAAVAAVARAAELAVAEAVSPRSTMLRPAQSGLSAPAAWAAAAGQGGSGVGVIEKGGVGASMDGQWTKPALGASSLSKTNSKKKQKAAGGATAAASKAKPRPSSAASHGSSKPVATGNGAASSKVRNRTQMDRAVSAPLPPGTATAAAAAAVAAALAAGAIPASTAGKGVGGSNTAGAGGAAVRESRPGAPSRSLSCKIPSATSRTGVKGSKGDGEEGNNGNGMGKVSRSSKEAVAKGRGGGASAGGSAAGNSPSSPTWPKSPKFSKLPRVANLKKTPTPAKMVNAAIEAEAAAAAAASGVRGGGPKPFRRTTPPEKQLAKSARQAVSAEPSSLVFLAEEEDQGRASLQGTAGRLTGSGAGNRLSQSMGKLELGGIGRIAAAAAAATAAAAASGRGRLSRSTSLSTAGAGSLMRPTGPGAVTGISHKPLRPSSAGPVAAAGGGGTGAAAALGSRAAALKALGASRSARNHPLELGEDVMMVAREAGVVAAASMGGGQPRVEIGLSAADKYASLDALDRAIAEAEAEVWHADNHDGAEGIGNTGGKGGLKGSARHCQKGGSNRPAHGEDMSDEDGSEHEGGGQTGGLRKNSVRWGDNTELGGTGRSAAAALTKSGRQGSQQQQEQKQLRSSGGGAKPVPFLKGPLHLAQLQPPPPGLEIVGKRLGTLKHARHGDDLQSSHGRTASMFGDSSRVEPEEYDWEEEKVGEEEGRKEGHGQQKEQEGVVFGEDLESESGDASNDGELQEMWRQGGSTAGRVAGNDDVSGEDSNGEGYTMRPPVPLGGEGGPEEPAAHYLDSVLATVADEVDLEQLKEWSVSAAPSRQLSQLGGEGKGEPKLLERQTSGSSSSSSMIGADRGGDDYGGKKFTLKFQIRSLGGSGGPSLGAMETGGDGQKQEILRSTSKAGMVGVDAGSFSQLQTRSEESAEQQQQHQECGKSQRRGSAVRQSRASYLSCDEEMDRAEGEKVGCQCVIM